MIPRNDQHFIGIERDSCAHAWASIPLDSGTRSAPVTGVENPFFRGMQSSKPYFIVTHTVDHHPKLTPAVESMIQLPEEHNAR
jgi:hypothetical protein